MAENDVKLRTKVCCVIASIFLFLLVYYFNHTQSQISLLKLSNELLRQDLETFIGFSKDLAKELDKCRKPVKLDSSTIASEEIVIESNEIEDFKPAHFDSPTEIELPRVVSNGIFPRNSSQYLENETKGRGQHDMEDVAILIEVHNEEDTQRWISAVKTHRKSRRDFAIYLYFPETNMSKGTTWTNLKDSVFAIKEQNMTEAIDDILFRKRKFIIFVKDTDQIGADFGEFYFLGKRILNNYMEIESFCGGSNEKIQNLEMGDVFWISSSKCQHGEMIPRRTLQDHILDRTGFSIRPEVARVGKQVTIDKKWNVDKANLEVFGRESFEKRLEYDISGSNHKMESYKSFNLKNATIGEIYVFPYSNQEELNYYGFEEEDVRILHMYKGIIPICVNSRCGYIVHRLLYEQRFIIY